MSERKRVKRDYAAERDILADALEQIIEIFADRERYVMLGPIAFSQAERIAKQALEDVRHA